MYTQFAHVYDELMRDVPYAEWAGHYARLMQRCGVPAGARCAECACGTGSLTVPLAREGYRMTGIDLSADMLEEAMKKARESGVEIPFERGLLGHSAHHAGQRLRQADRGRRRRL